MRKIIATKNAPSTIGPYSQANMVNNFIFTSGQIAIVPVTGKLVSSDIKEQTIQIFENLTAILNESGTNLENIVKTTCFLTNMDDFNAVNQIYSTYFHSGQFPSRSAFEVSRLPMDALIEIEAIAVI